MIRLAFESAPQINNLAHTTQAMLHSEHLLRESKNHSLEGSTAAPVSAPPPSGQPLTIAIGDWDTLFRAVEARLRLTVGERPATTPEPGDAAGRVQVIVLECVEALEQLHTALTYERSLRRQLELEVSDAQTTLARALANSSLLRPDNDALAT